MKLSYSLIGGYTLCIAAYLVMQQSVLTTIMCCMLLTFGGFCITLVQKMDKMNQAYIKIINRDEWQRDATAYDAAKFHWQPTHVNVPSISLPPVQERQTSGQYSWRYSTQPYPMQSTAPL